MRKTKVLKKNKHSKKTRKHRKICEKGATDESIRIKNLLIDAEKTNKKFNKNKKNNDNNTDNNINNNNNNKDNKDNKDNKTKTKSKNLTKKSNKKSNDQ